MFDTLLFSYSIDCINTVVVLQRPKMYLSICIRTKVLAGKMVAVLLA